MTIEQKIAEARNIVYDSEILTLNEKWIPDVQSINTRIGRRAKSFYDFANHEFAFGSCVDVSSAIHEIDDDTFGYIEWFNDEDDPEHGEYLAMHAANTVTLSDGTQMIVDFTYAQINPEETFPFVGTIEHWKNQLALASKSPCEETRRLYEYV